ncbi:hypothetical protein EIJ81_00925 (plasmid) [Aliivibrio salmonicida]|uniref:hypothetical protein n=1 Tax=Aliivibrio salmonicida TaxID=40269 RepID=UPI000F6CB6AE|nr:hypothetical protein [Aliivibrio salmonicida]AZL83463.1 hypothetical protein EIJ81_00925 [Aliivibrio salmonicida]
MNKLVRLSLIATTIMSLSGCDKPQETTVENLTPSKTVDPMLTVTPAKSISLIDEVEGLYSNPVVDQFSSAIADLVVIDDYINYQQVEVTNLTRVKDSNEWLVEIMDLNNEIIAKVKITDLPLVTLSNGIEYNIVKNTDNYTFLMEN